MCVGEVFTGTKNNNESCTMSRGRVFLCKKEAFHPSKCTSINPGHLAVLIFPASATEISGRLVSILVPEK